MPKSFSVAVVSLCALILTQSTAFTQTQGDANLSFEKQSYTYEEWIKGKFSEVATVRNPGKWIYVAGIGAEQEGDGKILFPGDFYKQCK